MGEPLRNGHVMFCSSCNLCDVLWENPYYGEANSAFLDHPFSYIYIHSLFEIVQKVRERYLLQMLICDKKSSAACD